MTARSIAVLPSRPPLVSSRFSFPSRHLHNRPRHPSRHGRYGASRENSLASAVKLDQYQREGDGERKRERESQCRPNNFRSSCVAQFPTVRRPRLWRTFGLFFEKSASSSSWQDASRTSDCSVRLDVDVPRFGWDRRS